MTEQEVLEKLTMYKDALLKIKTERDFYKEQLKLKDQLIDTVKQQVVSYQQKETESQNLVQKYEQLQQFCNTVQNELEKTVSQNGMYKSDIEKLQQQLIQIQSQNEQSKSKDDAAKNAFMQEIGRVLKDAEDVLQGE